MVIIVFSTYKRQRILHHYLEGHKAPTITKLLREEGLKASSVGISKFLIKYRETGSIGRKQGSGRPSIIMEEIKKVVEQMRLDDETTAHQLHKMLMSKGYSISFSTILQCRTSLGWTFRRSSYCQLIRHANKVKRLEWLLTICTATWPSKTLYLRINVRCSWKATDDFVAVSGENNQGLSRGN